MTNPEDGVFCIQNEVGTEGSCLWLTGSSVHFYNLAKATEYDVNVNSINASGDGGANSNGVWVGAGDEFWSGKDTGYCWTDNANGRLGTVTACIYSGTGTPEGSKTATVGSAYIRLDGGGGIPTFYTKKSGVGNTGWWPLMDGDMKSTGGGVYASADIVIDMSGVTPGVWEEVTDANIDEIVALTNNYTVSDGGLTPDAGAAYGLYLFSGMLHFKAQNNDIIEFVAYANGGHLETGYGCKTYRTMTGTDWGADGIHCKFFMSTTDEVRLYVKSTTTNNITLQQETGWNLGR
ncbi:MAG: hypothetical protein JRD89_01400 [Deltaproteobacteria bacterium]|nr:hypothetical protein [Deltaproteobacteria bacterium]